ncbi:nucleotidyltransferase domain-containing protein [Actinomyces sp. oral taxon 171]|uniref:nucleotidyltransferase domain-containing protein n=1 Tax=Actinomyces sp. oral taxon 171 TaxID=706438 RepID=UPI0001F61FB9|nr:nucleotidyltransferase domain-containing protein [Actinomyces sp. oral taxon 171]EFW26461.1 nucleotidyltransferase domain protein [Actinomyces sp. oral taxon 171 str. F0337]QCT34236.1 toxin-antitoxin system toxin subunit [Actinomyces sp. oral taxon 171 str. F0337]
MSVVESTASLAVIAQETDEAIRQARNQMVAAVRNASKNGMSQQEIARQIGRSQPEVSRLLHFHGTTPLARRLRAARRQVIEMVEAAGGSNVRVFGSVATGREHEGSDIDLLFHMDQPLGLMDLAGLEMELGTVLHADVDLVPDTNIRPTMRERIISEAVPL